MRLLVDLISNYESIDVSISWDTAERERQRVNGHVKHFNSLWEGKENGLETLEFPEAVRRRLLQTYSPTLSETEPGARRRLRLYQERAVESWVKANRSGVVSMATGAGKTLVALRCLETCPQPLLSLIVVPSMDLAKQWLTEIETEYSKICNVREASSQESNWPNQIKNLMDAF